MRALRQPPAKRKAKKMYRNTLEIPALDVSVIYIAQAFKAAAIFGLLYLLGFEYLKWDMLSLITWNPYGLLMAWPILLWATAWAIANSITGRYDQTLKEARTRILSRAVWTSIQIGFWEELIYRYLSFGIAMIVLPLVDWITRGVTRWVFESFLMPATHLMTFGALEGQILTTPWTVGAGIITANLVFVAAHVYTGHSIISCVNAWFVGLVLFWLALHYGLITSMVAHSVYDAVLLLTQALKAKCVKTRSRRLPV